MTEPYAESVIYVFVKGNNILTEKRYTHDSFVNCLPGGGIEETDQFWQKNGCCIVSGPERQPDHTITFRL